MKHAWSLSRECFFFRLLCLHVCLKFAASVSEKIGWRRAKKTARTLEPTLSENTLCVSFFFVMFMECNMRCVGFFFSVFFVVVVVLNKTATINFIHWQKDTTRAYTRFQWRRRKKKCNGINAVRGNKMQKWKMTAENEENEIGYIFVFLCLGRSVGRSIDEFMLISRSSNNANR